MQKNYKNDKLNGITTKKITVGNFIKAVKNGSVDLNAFPQRYKNQWSKDKKNELIYTAVTSDHIPEIILATKEIEEDGKVMFEQTYVIDGLQRTETLMDFMLGVYRTTKTFEDPFVEVEDNDDGFDLRNKTFDELPEELKENFKSVELTVVTHNGVTDKDIQKLVRRYNNQEGMNANQKAHTELDLRISTYKRDVENKSRFFKDCGMFNEKDKIKDRTGRVIIEALTLCYERAKYNKSALKNAKTINGLSDAQLIEFETMLDELWKVFKKEYGVRDSKQNEVSKQFNKKNTPIFLALYKKCRDYGLNADMFRNFMEYFYDEGRYTVIDVNEKKIIRTVAVDDNGVPDIVEIPDGCCDWQGIEKNKGTKDHSLINNKMNYLILVMNNFIKKENITIGGVKK